MTIQEVIDALERVKAEFDGQLSKFDSQTDFLAGYVDHQKTKGGYFRVGNIAIKISEITELT